MPANLTCVDSIIALRPADRDLRNKLRSNFKFLRTFLIYVSELIDVNDDLPQYLGDTLAEIEAAFADSASAAGKAPKVREKSLSAVWKNVSESFELINADDDLPQHLGDSVAEIEDPFAVGEASNEGKESLDAVCTNLLERFESFKPKIMQAYDYLSDDLNAARCHSSIKHSIWEQCVVSICENMDDLIRFKNLTDPLELHINALSKKLQSLEILMIDLGERDSVKLVDFWTHAVSVAISAAKLSFLCWVEDEGIEKDKMVKMALDMRQRIEGSTPEVLEVYLSAVKGTPSLESVGPRYMAKSLVKFLLPEKGKALVETYRRGLVYLLTFLIHTSQKHKEEDVALILADIRSVLLETTTIDYSTPRAQKYYPELLQFPEKIELLKAEVFLMDLLKSSGEGETSSIIPFESLENGLASLQIYRKRQQNQDHGKVKQLLTNFQMVVADVGSLWHLTQANSKAEEGEKDVLKLLLHIKLLKAEVYLMELLEDQTAFKDQSENLHQGLEILRKFLSRPPEEKSAYEKPILTLIEEVGRKALSVYHSFHASQETEDRAMEMNVSVSKLLEEIQLVRTEIEGTFSQVRRSSSFNFPETNGPGFVDYCLENLEKLVKHDATDYVNHQIKSVLKELKSLRSFVNDEAEHHEINDLRVRIVNLAYEADYVTDSIVLGNGSVCYHIAWLSDVIEELKFSNAQIKEVETVAETSTPRPLTLSSPKIEEFILELEHQESTIRDRLMGGTKDTEIVSIVGMGGIGKSTLAKQVFNDSSVGAEFPIRAWGCVSEVYDKRRLLLDIFNFVREPAEQVEDKTFEAIAHLLKQRLSRKRYLIVLDDLWDTQAWNDLVASFPDNKNGSRILLTSREHEVALNIIKGGSGPVPYELPTLDKDQSWNLLKEKVFHRKDCPWELVELGKEIAEGCHGLPLAIVAVAGLLKREEVNWWKKIANDVSIAAAANSWCMDILELSYKHLPEKLKPCFLYLGAFPGDKEILARKLLKLWIAEGFIRKDDPNVPAEIIADDYLKDLIARSLLIASEEKSQGGVKTCRVHSMLRQLCRSKAEKEHFLQPITGYDEHFDSSYHESDFGVHPYYAGPSSPIKYEEHRLSIYSKRNHFAMLKPSGPPVRSLLFFATNDKSPSCRYDISFISHNFKLLIVLDLESINVESSFPPGIVLLERLRYLAVSGDIDSIPPSIDNLWNLETFIVKGLKGTVIIPEAIWGMQNLKHFHVGDTALVSFQPKNSSKLVSLSTLSLSCGEVAKKIAKKLRRLQKLRCIFSKSPGHSSGNCKRSPVLSFLTRLESLNVSYYGGIPHSCEFGFPSGLKKLSLSNLHLPKSYISTIGRLPELKVLKLISVAFDEQKWEMENEEFSELEYLKIDNSGIVQWIASQVHLPNIRGLVLRSCSQLKTVPSSFSEIDSLQMIELQWCDQDLIDSALKIQEEKRDANQPFKLLIKGL